VTAGQPHPGLLAEGPGGIGNDPVEQLLLARIVVVQGRRLHAGAAGDLAHGGAVVSALVEERSGHLPDALVAVHSVRSIQVIFSRVYLSIAWSDLSTPIPDCLKVANGTEMSPRS